MSQSKYEVDVRLEYRGEFLVNAASHEEAVAVVTQRLESILNNAGHTNYLQFGYSEIEDLTTFDKRTWTPKLSGRFSTGPDREDFLEKFNK